MKIFTEEFITTVNGLANQNITRTDLCKTLGLREYMKPVISILLSNRDRNEISEPTTEKIQSSYDNESEFISKCASKGITSPSDICDAASVRIKEIDSILFDADKLRKEKAIMISILKTFGQDAKPKKRTMISEEKTSEELDDKSLELTSNICKLIEAKGPLFPRDIMNELGTLPDHDFEVYSVIKWLCSNGITSRLDNRSITKGPKWESKP